LSIKIGTCLRLAYLLAIDLMIAVKGLDFEASYDKAINFEDDGLVIRTIHKDDLIKAKKAVGRSKDLDDLENLSSNA
jgi:hypothetical protein